MGYIFDIPDYFLLPENYGDFIDYILNLPVDNFIKKQLLLELAELQEVAVITDDILLVYPEEFY